jgi:hypothetical protein
MQWTKKKSIFFYEEPLSIFFFKLANELLKTLILLLLAWLPAPPSLSQIIVLHGVV